MAIFLKYGIFLQHCDPNNPAWNDFDVRLMSAFLGN